MNVILDLTAAAIAAIWMTGFFGIAGMGLDLDYLPFVALAVVVARYVSGRFSDRKKCGWIKSVDYDAEN